MTKYLSHSHDAIIPLLRKLQMASSKQEVNTSLHSDEQFNFSLSPFDHHSMWAATFYDVLFV